MTALVGEARGLENFQARLSFFPKVAARSAKLAVNDTLRWARVKASKEVRSQINLTASYLNQTNRLFVSRFASDNRLSGVLSARRRPTQLAQFSAKQRVSRIRNGPAQRKGIRVKVKRSGTSKVLRGAFFVKLKRGSQGDGNVGVAVRSTDGLNLRNAGVSSGKNHSGFRVLYGPSVDQVFDTVREDLSPVLSGRLQTRFDHHFSRLLKIN
ncbi:MAG: hypothetical protein K6L81_01945 [Agarilytica sp.]